MPKEPHTKEGGYYRYKGKDYMISKLERGVFLIKDSATGKWVDAVEYVHAHPDDRTHIFTRAASDFDKFERIPDPEPDEPPAEEEGQAG
jgi:hypothetical protein